jgi:hypothetical protein
MLEVRSEVVYVKGLFEFEMNGGMTWLEDWFGIEMKVHEITGNIRECW